MKKSMQKGFTLIELMIVIAIIGVLAAVAIPAYTDYIAKSQVTAGLAEIQSAKAVIETQINDGTVADVTATDDSGLGAFGLKLTGSQRCSAISITTKAGGSTNKASIECTLKGSGTIVGKKVQFYRTVDAAGTAGVWKCVTDAVAKYAPVSCGNGTLITSY
jgi:type IV pilus assembly protein PilA